MIRVVQLSDTHFAQDGHRSHRGFGYDTDAAFAAVHERAFGPEREAIDYVVITGDVVDNGLDVEYEKASAHLRTIPHALRLTPGNHDFHEPFQRGVMPLSATQDRAFECDNWLFVLADSNHNGKVPDGDGGWVDAEDRVEKAGGMLGPHERAWIDEQIAASDAEHVWIWVHHPPGMHIKGFTVSAYDTEIAELLEAHDRIRGIGAGHVHTDAIREFAERAVHVCPALTINLDYETFTLLPPGFRRYRFHPDGRVDSECELIDDPRWPRRRIPSLGVRYLLGDEAWREWRTSRPKR